MADKNTKNYIIEFNERKPTPEERNRCFFDLVRLLQRIELENIRNSKDILEEEKAETLSKIYPEQKEFFIHRSF